MPPTSEPSPEPEKKRKRTAVACHPCRHRKRACDGVKPTCTQCCDAAWVCDWPERDRRKRDPGLEPRPFPLPGNKTETSSSLGGDKTPPVSNSVSATLSSNSRLHHGQGLPISTDIPVDGAHQDWNATSEACQMDNGPRNSFLRSSSSSRWAGPHFWSINGRTDTQGDESRIPPGPNDFDGAQHLLALNANTQSVSFASDVQQQHQQETGPTSYPVLPQLRPQDAHPPPESAKISYEYLRPYGITAIQPGLGRVRLSIRSDPPPASSSNGPSPSYSTPDHTSQPSHPLIDRSTRLPRTDVRASLIAGFFDHFQSIFLFANRYSLEGGLLGRPELGTVFMVNTMCALSARFSDHPEIIALSPLPFCRGVAFADNAKQLLIPLMGLPSADTAAALLFLSYYAFGMNSESELWMYSGMAMRMAVDLGLGRRMGSRSIRKADRLLFWSIYMLDRILSIGTGRPTTLPDSQIDLNEPVVDFHTELGLSPTGPIPAMYARLKDSSGCTLAFAWAVKMVRLYGKVADIVNGPKFWSNGMTTGSAMPTRAPSPEPRPTLSEASAQAAPWSSKHVGFADIQPRTRQPSPMNQSDLNALADLENAIVQAYDSLPEVLIWSEQNLEEHVGAHDGDMYIHIHLWYHCMIAILYRDPLVQVSAATAHISLVDAKQIQRSSAEEIQKIAEHVASNNLPILLNNCFLNQTFYTAALAWAADSTTQPRTSSKLLAKSLSGNSSKALERFQYCAKLLRKQSEVWSGVGWIAAALAKRSSGMSLQDMAAKGGVTDTILSETEMRIITTGERPQEEEALSELRENLLMTLPDDALDPNGLTMLWGADGLFDAEMDQLFFGFT